MDIASTVTSAWKIFGLWSQSSVPLCERSEASGDEERLEKKFRWLTSFVLGGNRIDDLLKMLWHFDAVQDVHELTSLLHKR